MAIITFDIAAFRIAFPAFANTTTFPNATLQMYWDSATCIMDPEGSYGYLTDTCRERGLNLLTAHLTAISVLIAAGDTPGVVSSATIDKVSVTLEPPPSETQFQWWLNTTPYGQQLNALLQVFSVGGWSVGGYPELSSFRRVGGVIS